MLDKARDNEIHVEMVEEPPAKSIAFSLERLGLIPMKAPILSCIVLVILMVGAVFGIDRIKIDDSLSQLFRSNTKEFRQYEEVTKKFLEGFDKDFKGTMRAGFDGLVHEKTDPDLKKWLLTRAETQDVKMALGLMRDLSALDSKAILKNAKVPVRCINSGGGFKFFTPTDVAINEKYADFNAVTIDAVGHYPMLEKPAEFNLHLAKTLKEVITAGS